MSTFDKVSQIRNFYPPLWLILSTLGLTRFHKLGGALQVRCHARQLLWHDMYDFNDSQVIQTHGCKTVIRIRKPIWMNEWCDKIGLFFFFLPRLEFTFILALSTGRMISRVKLELKNRLEWWSSVIASQSDNSCGDTIAQLMVEKTGVYQNKMLIRGVTCYGNW